VSLPVLSIAGLAFGVMLSKNINQIMALLLKGLTIVRLGYLLFSNPTVVASRY
jgi:hypothetical protein